MHGGGGLKACRGADILVHEATLADGHQERAVEHGHSTPSMAAAVARSCEVRRLVLSHFSQRYKPVRLQKDNEEDNILELQIQAEDGLRGTVTEVVLAEDFLTLPIPIKRP